jgi:hypothetical protein
VDDTEGLEEDNSIDNYAVFSLDDDPVELNFLGKIISVEYARKFLQIAADEDVNLKEIAKKITEMENPRIPNAVSWKNRLEKIGLITSKLKRQRKKGHFLKYYKGKDVIIIAKNKALEELIKNDEELEACLRRILKTGKKLGVPIVAALISHLLIKFPPFTIEHSSTSASTINYSIVIPIIVLVGALVLVKYGSYLKSKLIR